MKLLHIFKVILLLLLPCFVLAQYPNNPVKSRLGWQTTGDGLVYRGSGAPAYSPGTMFNAWMYLDTTNYTLYMYRNFQWTKLPLVNNGLTLDGSYVQLGGSLVENTTVSTGTYDLLLGRTSGTNHAWINIYGSGGYAGLFNSYNSGALEAEITAGGGTASLLVENITDGGNSSIYVTKDGFQASYLHPVIGASFFKMDSTKFRIRGLVSYASHSAADAANTEYQLYQINNSRAVYVKNGATTSQDILGTGTTNRVPLWTATNTLGNSNIQDNNTAISILNSKPFQLGQWTTAGRPTGTSGYMGWNTTLTGIDWYNGTRWATGLESTFARGTATRIPFFDANGQVTDDAGLAFTASTGIFSLPSGSDILTFDGSNSSGFPEIRFFNQGISELFILAGSWPGGRQGAIFAQNAAGTTLAGIRSSLVETSNIFGLQTLELSTTSGVTPFLKIFRAGVLDLRQEITSGGIVRWYNFDTSQDYFSFDRSNARVGVLTASPRYKFDVNSTEAIGLARGTTAQRPTIVSNTTPFRFNTDNTVLEYGESVGVWRSLANTDYVIDKLDDSLQTYNGIIYVSKNGSNSTGKRNNPRKPFLTIKAATQAAQDGDLIYIFPGVYREGGNTLGKDSINFYCSPGVTVSNAVITDDYGTSDMDNGGYVRWFGSGVFDSCTVSIQHMNMRYHVEGDSINLTYIPLWRGINYNDVRLKFKFRSVRTYNNQLVWMPGKSSELTYTRMNLIFEIDRIYSPGSTKNHPLIHFANGAGGTDSDAKSKFVDCNFIFDIKNIELTGGASIGSFPRLQGLIFGAGGIVGRIHFQRSNLSFNSEYIVQTGSTGSTYETPFQGLENSNTLFGIGTFKLDSSRLNFNIKSIHSDIHAFRIGEMYQGAKGMVNITGNFTTRQLSTFHVIETGSGATGDTSILIRVNGSFSSDKEVVSCHSTVPTEKITWSGNYNSFADKAVFAIKSDKFTISNAVLQNKGTTADIYAAEARAVKIAGTFAENLTVSSNVTANWLDNIGNPKFFEYGIGTKTAAALSKTQSNYLAGFATDGTVLDLERKRDTTILITNTNYDFSAAVTTAQVLSRYSRVVIYIKCTSAATASNTVTLHTPDANLAQTEIIIHSIDDNGTYRNDINFTTNGAVNTIGGTISTYNLSAGEQKRVRVVNDGGWKYFFGY